MEQSNTPAWMQDESIQKIDKAKLEFLNSCFAAMQGKEKDKKALMAVLSTQIKNARQKGLQFTPEEMNIAVNAIKKGGTPESNKQIDDILSGKIKKPF